MGLARLLVVVLGLVAWGGGKHAVEAGSRPPAPADAAVGSAATPPHGDAVVRVEWHDVPVAMRASPGRTACKTPRASYVSPTTTWGIPDAVVWTDAGAPPAAATVRIALRDCAMTPRIAVARVGATLELASETEGPVTLALMHFGDPADDKALRNLIETPGSLPAGVLDRVSLPVVGHAVDVALARPAVDAVSDANAAADAAAILVTQTAAGVTDATGQVVLHDLPPGSHALTAWIPARAGQQATIARGKVDVVAGGQAEVTLTVDGR